MYRVYKMWDNMVIEDEKHFTSEEHARNYYDLLRFLNRGKHHTVINMEKLDNVQEN